MICPRCERGAEACAYCHDLPEADWRAICDCGLYDFGDHLLGCEDRADKRWVIAGTYEQAEEPREA